MRPRTDKIESFRIRTGPRGSDKTHGMNGAFEIPRKGVMITVIASDGRYWKRCNLPGQPWEHVSVSTPGRCPTWMEMDYVKRLFWADDETVIQMHVPRKLHINQHEFCLHLWKPTKTKIPLPPMKTVGWKT